MHPVPIETPLGRIVAQARAHGDPGFSAAARMNLLIPQLALPSGMSVTGVQAVIFSVLAHRTLKEIEFECMWGDTAPCEGSPETGEWLDAQAWETDSHVVMIGTEDLEALRSRLSFINLPDEPYPIAYLDKGLRITVPKLHEGQRLSLHFVIAHNPIPEPGECSTWFAVDVPHKQLLQTLPA